MRKRTIAVLCIVLLSLSTLPLNVFATANTKDDFSSSSLIVQSRWSILATITCSIDFIGTTGYVNAKAMARSGTSNMSGTVTVYKKVVFFWFEVTSWSNESTSSTLNINETFTGESGNNYKAVFDVTATYNGIPESASFEATGTCS